MSVEQLEMFSAVFRSTLWAEDWVGKRPWKLILDPGPCGGNALELLQKFPGPWRKFLQWKGSLRASYRRVVSHSCY